MKKKSLIGIGVGILIALVGLSALVYMNMQPEPYTMNLKITGLDCEDCPEKLLEVVTSIPDVKNASLSDGMLVVTYKRTPGLTSQILYDIGQAGFGAVELSSSQKKLHVIDYKMRLK